MPTWQQHQSFLRQWGCVVCRNLGHPDTPAEIHHIRTGTGVGRKADQFDVIPLCPLHHRNGNYGEAIHAGKRTWEAKFGTELELMEQAKQAAANYFARYASDSLTD